MRVNCKRRSGRESQREVVRKSEGGSSFKECVKGKCISKERGEIEMMEERERVKER